MTDKLSLVRGVVASAALAQTLFWLCTLAAQRNGVLVFDLVFFWLTLPTILCLLSDCLPLAAGLAAGSFTLNSGILLLALQG